MYQTCPKCRYQRTEADTVEPGICPACGLVFTKWLKQQFSDSSSQPRAATLDYDNDHDGGRIGATITERRHLILHAERPKESLTLYARLILLIVFAVWGCISLRLVSRPMPSASHSYTASTWSFMKPATSAYSAVIS